MKTKLNQKTDHTIKLEEVLGEMYDTRLGCLESMIWYYQCVNQSIWHLAGRKGYSDDTRFARMSPEEVRDFRRYINTDLDNLSLEFYLQRTQWALRCFKERNSKRHLESALKNPALHPCQMRKDTGFQRIATSGDKMDYRYEEFLGETLPIFVAIHSHLTSINRALGNLYYYITEVPFSSFTPTGKTEILHMTKELERLMLGLLVATHLQPKEIWHTDLVNCLISCRSDCYRFLETIPRYYQNHRMRLVVFPIDPVPKDIDPYSNDNKERYEPLPLSCVPWSAGAYLDFLDSYQSIAHHLRAVIVWSIRLYSLWYFVPRRYLRQISPMSS